MKNKMIIRYKKIHPLAAPPVFGSIHSAGADLCAISGEDIVIAPGKTEFIHTGLAIEVPVGYAGLVYARSGLASKSGLAPANKVGVIDSDYRGEILVALHNHSETAAAVRGGDRIAQLIIAPVPAVEYVESDDLSDTLRGSGGFGSTGK